VHETPVEEHHVAGFHLGLHTLHAVRHSDRPVREGLFRVGVLVGAQNLDAVRTGQHDQTAVRAVAVVDRDPDR
jgi:hypothetical protein